MNGASKHNWYDNAEIVHKADKGKLTEIKVSLPYYHDNFNEIVFVGQNLEHEGLRWLIDVLQKSLITLQNRDK
jgi:hypothetical protein